jgi:hypothetical protein
MIHDRMQKDKNYLTALSASHTVLRPVVELLRNDDLESIRRNAGMP